MITRDAVMPLLLDACPSFRPLWAEVEADNKEGEDRLHYVDAGDFVRHLANLSLAGATEEFPTVFQVIERLIIEGDDFVKNLAVIGYLEGMQMATVTSRGLDPVTTFGPFLAETSARWWARLDRFWAGERDALNVEEP